MKNEMGKHAKLLWTAGMLPVIAAVVVMLASPADARPGRPGPPGPLCGPTILFECTFPDGSTELVGLTRCEVDKFEKKNRATCEPASF